MRRSVKTKYKDCKVAAHCVFIPFKGTQIVLFLSRKLERWSVLGDSSMVTLAADRSPQCRRCLCIEFAKFMKACRIFTLVFFKFKISSKLPELPLRHRKLAVDGLATRRLVRCVSHTPLQVASKLQFHSN